MARNEVAEKIARHLTGELSVWNETDVVYLLVEVRKLLDHARNETQANSPHLRFYCDWVVHISKDRIDPITLDVVKNMESGIKRQIHQPNMFLGEEAINFAYFRSMQDELLQLMKAEGIDAGILSSEDKWSLVVSILVKALENQPLNIEQRHGLNIKRLIFLPSAPGAVIMRIDFNEPISDRNGRSYPFYTLKNAY
jgi:hypothetical protein